MTGVCAQIVVNAIVDTLKTAFPRPDAQSPTEDEAEVDGLKTGSDKKSRCDSGAGVSLLASGPAEDSWMSRFLSPQVPSQVLREERPLRGRLGGPAAPVQLRAAEHGGSPGGRCWSAFRFYRPCRLPQVFGRMSLEELERFIAEQEDAASGAEPEPEERPGHGQVLDVRLGEKRCPEPGSEPGTEPELSTCGARPRGGGVR